MRYCPNRNSIKKFADFQVIVKYKYIFLLNTLYQLKNDGSKFFCRLNNDEKCEVCIINLDFCDFEKNFFGKMSYRKYLENYISKRYRHLSNLFYS